MLSKIVLFDGACCLCQSSVQFIIRHDKTTKFAFASLQSKSGMTLLKQYHLQGQDPLTSIVLIEDGQAYQQSTAILKIAKQLDGLWPMAYGFIIIPPFIRHWVYQFIGKRRYQWWGKMQQCWQPTAEIKNRFISDDDD